MSIDSQSQVMEVRVVKFLRKWKSQGSLVSPKIQCFILLRNDKFVLGIRDEGVSVSLYLERNAVNAQPPEPVQL